MANCCVAKQSHRTQAHPTPCWHPAHTTPASVSSDLSPPPRHHSKCPLPRQLFPNYAASNKVAMGDDAACKLLLPRSPLLLSLSLPVFLIISSSLSLSLYYFWYFCSWAELLTRSFCVDCPHPLAGLWFEFVLSCSGKRQYEVLHNFYLYLPCCFCHVFFFCSRYCCCCCLLFGSVLAMFCTANSLPFFLAIFVVYLPIKLSF